MSYRVVFLPAADQDMDDIEEYLSQFYASTVLKFFLQLEEKVATLKDMPYMYPAYDDDTYFRRMVVDDYLLFYSVDEKRQLVVIHRVLHNKADVNRQILSPNTMP
jgi:plasmid stabilization system protein ParE